MFYQPGITAHGLPRDPFKASVVPRPIGWISTKNIDGTDNLAPYSQFNNLTFDPPMVMFSANQTAEGTRKDTVINAEREREFVWNLATWATREAVNASSEQVPYGKDEFEIAGLTKEKAALVKAAMVKESPVKFECRYHSTVRIPGNPPVGTVDEIIIATVIGIHIDDSVLTDGKIDIRKTKPIARCGYFEYACIEDTFEMIMPGNAKAWYGLEGNAAANAEAHRRANKE